jgi:uncharacterized DUF497 family protein
VRYEWDEPKRISNLEKHEIDFWNIYSFDWRTATYEPSPRFGEFRWVATGYIGERLYRVVFTDRGEQRRIISLRKANPREERRYAQT